MTTTVLATEKLKKTRKNFFPGLTHSLTHMLTSRGASTEDLIRRERNYQTRDKYLRNAANSSSVSPAIGVVQSGDQGVTNMCGAKILLKQTPAD